MTLRRGFELKKGEKVVIAEDVLTTGRSINEVRALVQELGGELTAVAVIVDRSSGKADFGVPLITLMTMEVVTCKPEFKKT